MLPFTKWGERGPLVVVLHWLGGSARTWTEVGEALAGRGFQCVALDLPGFGRAVDCADTGVEATAVAVIETVGWLRAKDASDWFLAGHSMGGKLSAIVARAACDGEPRLEGLRGLVLVSPSPPGPEPMEESTRRRMLRSLGESTRDAEEDRRKAEKFVDDNVGKLPLEGSVQGRTVEDVLRMNRAAFTAWLTTGSQEDWAERVGTLPLPALVMAGSEEPALGPDVQREVTLPHFAEAELVPLVGGGHLGPLERAEEVADRVMAFVGRLGCFPVGVRAPVPESFQALIDSERTSPLTRAVLNGRASDDGDEFAVGVLSFEELLVLRAVARRVIPGCSFDLASRIQDWLGLPAHDGWRHDSLPPDAEAWCIGIRSVDAAALQEFGVPFLALDAVRQDGLLLKAGKGKLGGGILNALHLKSSALFTGSQMARWFGDVCAELTKIYVADPRTMQRMGFTGFADDGGFTRIRLGERESFEI